MIFGDVENGGRETVTFGPFTGIAGIRQREGGREVAYYGEKPRSLPVTGKIGDEEAVATKQITTQARGFVVLWVPDA